MVAFKKGENKVSRITYVDIQIAKKQSIKVLEDGCEAEHLAGLTTVQTLLVRATVSFFSLADFFNGLDLTIEVVETMIRSAKLNDPVRMELIGITKSTNMIAFNCASLLIRTKKGDYKQAVDEIFHAQADIIIEAGYMVQNILSRMILA